MVSNAVVAEVLKGIDFPATRQECVDYAKKRSAPKEVVEALERMPAGKFVSMADVWHAIGVERKEGKMPGPITK
jgi:Protein of unknown function (DUF2795).